MALNVTDVNYSWQFNTLECYPTASGHTDVVCKAFYVLTASTGSYSVYTGGYQNFPLPSGGTFIPFDDLTLEIVQGWVESAMGNVYLYNIKKDLALQLDNKINPPVEKKPAPWLPTPTPTPTPSPTPTRRPTNTPTPTPTPA